MPLIRVSKMTDEIHEGNRECIEDSDGEALMREALEQVTAEKTKTIDDGYTRVSNRWLAENYSKAQRTGTVDTAVTVTDAETPLAEDTATVALRALAEMLGAPRPLVGRDLMMADMKAGGRVRPEPAKLSGRDFFMARMKAGGVLPGSAA
jgi:hypothetical protein